MSNITIPLLPPVIALSGAEFIEVVQAGTSSRATVSQIASALATYTAGTGLTLSGNQFSITATGAVAGTYTVPSFSVNAQGQITSITSGTKTGTGAVVLANSPTLVAPALGTPTSVTLTNAVGLPLSTGITGTLAFGNGGTGLTATPSNGQLLIGNGTGYSLATLTAGSNITITNTAGGITIASTAGGSGTVTSVNASGGTTGLNFSGGPITTSGTLTLAGTLVVANGGTGVTTSTGTGSVVLSNSPTLVTPTFATGGYQMTAQSMPSYSEGLVWYDSTQHSLAFYNDGVTSPVYIGEDIQVKVINNTGSTIANGIAVYVTGTASGQIYPNIAPAKADVSVTSAVIGLTNGSIASGAIGYVTSQGVITNVNTGILAPGTVLYLSPYSAGQLQATVPPTGVAVQVGTVTYQNSSTGQIYVKQTTPLAVSASTITGTVAVANGGTGIATTPANGALLIGNGSGYTSATLTAGSNIVITNTAGNITIASTGMVYPGAGIAVSTGSAWATSLSSTAPTFTTSVSSPSHIITSNATTTTLQGSASATATTYTLPASAPGANGYVLSSTTAGVMSWIAISGSGTVTSVDASGGTTGLTLTGGPITTSGTLTLGGTLAVANGGTGTTSLTGYVKGSGTSALSGFTLIPASDITGLASVATSGSAADLTTGSLAVARLGGGTGANSTTFWRGDGTWSTATVYPGAGIANSTGSAWGTSYTTAGTGTVLALATNPTLNGTITFNGGAFSAAAWTTNGIGIIQAATTYTDTTSTGTVANVYVNKFGTQTVAASNAVTYTSLVGTWYSSPVAGTNVTAPSVFALGADSILSGGYIRCGQNTSGNFNGSLDIFSSGTGLSYMRLLRGASSWWSFTNNGNNDLEISTGYLNYSVSTIMPAMYLQRISGNVGLSNTSPAYRFDASGAIRGYGLLSSQVPNPSAPSGVPSTTGGTLAAATYYFKIVAIDGQGNSTAASAESTGVTTTGTTSSIALTWTRIAGVASYQVWYATASGAQANYYAVTVNQPAENYLTASFTFTAAAGTSGTIPTNNLTGGITVSAGAVALAGPTGTVTHGLGNAATVSGSTKTVNIGTGGLSGSTTVIAIGSTAAPGVITVNGSYQPLTASTTSGSTITPTAGTTNQYNVTALAASATIAAPSGTPVDGQRLTIRFKDNGTAQTLTWATTSGAYRAVGVVLPTTTVISKALYVGCIYNSQDSFWDVVAVAQQ
jgi:hypothetical protein